MVADDAGSPRSAHRKSGGDMKRLASVGTERTPPEARRGEVAEELARAKVRLGSEASLHSTTET